MGADIINISLGVNKTNSKIEEALTKASNKDIFIVTAAGNDGPDLETIGSPGQNRGTLTVGSTYNNLTSSLVATLEVDEKHYTVIPMAGSAKLDIPITSEMIFGNYAKETDFDELNAEGKIILAERGSDVEGELLYFSIKEANAANAGAKALIVFNHEPGIFLGELIHEFVEPDYAPRLPVVSMDRKDGLELKEILENPTEAIIHLFYNPDFVAHFSSRGPVSSFYIKPDIVAPGAYINTTQINGGYNFTSGTSYATPHVSGAAALLLQKNPNIEREALKSILMTTAEPVSDAYGNLFSVNEAGTGRLNVSKAFDANLVILPPNQVLSLSAEKNFVNDKLELRTLEGTLDGLIVSFDGPEFLEFEHVIDEEFLQFRITANENNFGTHETRINIEHDKIKYTVPILLHFTEATISTTQDNGKLNFDVFHTEQWSFAKITVTNMKTGETDIVTLNPDKDTGIQVYDEGQYWIEAKIRVGIDSFDAYEKVFVNSVSVERQGFVQFDIPQRQLIIIAGIAIIIGIVGFAFKRRTTVKV